jgi:hypothetical protein
VSLKATNKKKSTKKKKPQQQSLSKHLLSKESINYICLQCEEEEEEEEEAIPLKVVQDFDRMEVFPIPKSDTADIRVKTDHLMGNRYH